MVLGWGVVGLGYSATNLLAPAIAADENSRIVAAVSRDAARAREFAERFGAVWAGTDYAAMLREPSVHAVLITSPNAFHIEQLIAAARAGKHVLCDKPLALTSADAERALQECDQAGIKLGIVFQTRRYPCFQDARHAISSGAIGDVLQVQIEAGAGDVPFASWRADPELAGVGTINNVGVHVLDLLRFLLGSDVSEVCAMLEVGKEPRLERMALALMRFVSGAMAFVNCNQICPMPVNDIVIHGTLGRILGRGITRQFASGEMTIATPSGTTTKTYSSESAYRATVSAFSAALLGGQEPDPSGTDGLRCVQLTEAIVNSARNGRVVPVRH